MIEAKVEAALAGDPDCPAATAAYGQQNTLLGFDRKMMLFRRKKNAYGKRFKKMCLELKG